VLIIGASGGVGSYGVQIAKALGGDVTGICSHANQAMVLDLGASRVVDYNVRDFVKEGECYDIIFDTIGRHNLKRCAPVLKAGGTYVSTVPSSENLKAVLITKLKSLFVSSVKNAKVVMVTSEGRDLHKITTLISEGKVRSVIDQIFPVHKVAQAHDYSRSLRAKGKIILSIQPEGRAL